MNDQLLTSKEKVGSIVKMLIRAIGSEGRSARVFFREMRNLRTADIEEISEKRDQFRKNFEKVILAGIENGEFRSDLSPDIVTLGILGICNWSYFWFDSSGPVTDEEVSEIYMEMIFNGIENKLHVATDD